MKVQEIEPILIKYEGLDAERNVVELESLSRSLRGVSKLLKASGQLALTGRLVGTEDNAVKVYALPPQPGSYDIWTIVQITSAVSLPVLPYIDLMVRTAATKATEALVNATIAKWAGRKKESVQANEVAVRALEEMGHTAREAMKMAERLTLSNHSAVKLLVAPIGVSTGTVRIGQPESGAFNINYTDRVQIEQTELISIGPEQSMRVNISELDLVKKTCKVSLVDGDQTTSRISGEITDPVLAMPNNPYSTAFDRQTPITVKCKPQISGGQIERLFISDAA